MKPVTAEVLDYFWTRASDRVWNDIGCEGGPVWRRFCRPIMANPDTGIGIMDLQAVVSADIRRRVR